MSSCIARGSLGIDVKPRRPVEKAVQHALSACVKHGMSMVKWCHTALKAEVEKVEAIAESRNFEQAVAYASENM